MNYETAIKLLNYDPITGILTWKLRDISEFPSKRSYYVHKGKASRPKAGSLSRTMSGKEYIQLHVGRKKYLAHRVAYLIHFGVIPEVIDHLDGDGTNNKILNLRDGTLSDNARNTKRSSANTTGHTGVYANKRNPLRPWRVFIKVGGKMMSRGTFKTIDEAIVERGIAEREHGFSQRHGC